jgi:hypothetical protein
MMARMEPSTFGLQVACAGGDLPEEWQALLADQVAVLACTIIANADHCRGCQQGIVLQFMSTIQAMHGVGIEPTFHTDAVKRLS